MTRTRTYTALAGALLGAFGATYACSNDESASTTTNPTQSGPGGGNTGGTGAQGGGVGGEGNVFSASGGNGGQGNEGGACADVVVEADVKIKPADIVFIVDNSGSMTEELNAIEQNINVNFAQIIGASQVDYRIIMLTDHGPSVYEICIGPPLGGTIDCNGPPVEVPGKFYHYSVNVQSTDSLCKILDTLYGPMGGGEADEFNLHPQGWISLLRPEAVKVFVEITDDSISCNWNGNYYSDYASIQEGQTTAVNWDQDLLAHAPGQFGTVAQRNYLFYSIVGLPKNGMTMNGEWSEFDPVQSGTCPTAVSSGYGYQWLSKGTEVLRFPVCEATMPNGYAPVFNEIAAGVIEGTQVPCEINVPEPPPGQMLDPNSLSVLYTPGNGGAVQEFEQVPSAAACGMADNKFYIENDTIHLCPSACDAVTADQMAGLEVKVQCGFIQ